MSNDKQQHGSKQDQEQDIDKNPRPTPDQAEGGVETVEEALDNEEQQ